ncbi:MAG: hypothetical protein IKX60_02795 [Bacteroidales bacterium]|nr:hypothetical protein [Bacteroidales bacterium]
MKRFRLFLSAAILIAVPSIANAQAFSKDDPVGAEQVFVTTTAEGWVSDRTVYRIVGKEESAARTTLTLSQQSSVKTAKDSLPIETTLTVKILYTPNSIVIPKENFAASASMVEEMFEGRKVEMSFSGDDPSVPNNLSVGQKLPDTEVRATITIEGINAKMSVKSTDRRITAKERVTVPAGAYDAFVLEENSTVKVSVLILSQSEKESSKSWVVPGMGEVKTVTYDKKGKLESTSVMTSYTK